MVDPDEEEEEEAETPLDYIWLTKTVRPFGSNKTKR
jgi:hypothetical protein